MNYANIYNQIIYNRQQNIITRSDTYCEEHHIIPRALGGSDEKINKLMLTAKEHYVCHHLLTKMYKRGTRHWHKMVKAFMRMHSSSSNQYRYFNARTYEKLKIDHAYSMSVSQSGKGNSQYGTMWISNVEERKSKRILKTDPMPNNWRKGRILNFDKFIEAEEKKRKGDIEQNKQQKIKDKMAAIKKQRIAEEAIRRGKIKDETIIRTLMEIINHCAISTPNLNYLLV
jgi:hypothetical protein